MTGNGNKIAIIGGGVSGLAVAYHLITKKEPIEGLEVVVFERGKTLGGNADTVKVKLGRDYAQEEHPGFNRWADLGVNDFNKKSYKNMVEAMKKIGFHDYKRLEDTVCFFTPDGSVLYTVDDFYKDERDKKKGTRRIVDDRFCVPSNLAKENERFMNKAAGDVDGCRDQYKHMTVAKYVEKYIEENAKKKEDKALIKEMAEHILYPRIAAMYFVDERGPQAMPIVAVMEYYILQENYPKVKEAKRMYFENGSQNWINRLHKWLEGENRKPEDKDLPKVTTCYDFQASVIAKKGGASVYSVGERGIFGTSGPERFDKVVFACHADDALRSFGPEGWTDENATNVATMLGKVSYTNSIAVCHTFTGVLPPHRDAWRTYNVMIRKGTALTPYSMTYVINRHQNDYAKDSEHLDAGLPQYFVTLNPAVPIPDEYVLPTTEESTEARAKLAPGYLKIRPVTGDKAVNQDPFKAVEQVSDKAIGWFRHNVLDFDCLQAQEMLVFRH